MRRVSGVSGVSVVSVNLHSRIMLPAALVARAPAMKSCHQRGGTEEEPFKGSKHITSNSRSARSPFLLSMSPSASNVRQQHGERNKTRKPKQHGKDFSSQDSELVRGGGVSCRRDDQVDECEEGPNGGEDQEVDLRRRPPPGPVVCGICQDTKYDCCEETLDSPYREHEGCESEAHVDGAVI